MSKPKKVTKQVIDGKSSNIKSSQTSNITFIWGNVGVRYLREVLSFYNKSKIECARVLSNDKFCCWNLYICERVSMRDAEIYTSLILNELEWHVCINNLITYTLNIKQKLNLLHKSKV